MDHQALPAMAAIECDKTFHNNLPLKRLAGLLFLDQWEHFYQLQWDLIQWKWSFLKIWTFELLSENNSNIDPNYCLSVVGVIGRWFTCNTAFQFVFIFNSFLAWHPYILPYSSQRLLFLILILHLGLERECWWLKRTNSIVQRFFFRVK